MKSFVLDNSVAMRWLLKSNKPGDQRYANAVLESMIEAEALVPDLWHLEAANVMLSAMNRGDLDTADVERFIAQLENLPVQVDPMTAQQAFSRTLVLGQAYRLSTYDSAYLELAIRTGSPLATLDKDLRKAAQKAKVKIYLD